MCGKRNAYRILVGKPEGKRPLGRSRRKWVDNIRIDFRDVGWGGMNWIYLAQDGGQSRALVNTEINLGVPKNIGGFSKRAQLREAISSLVYYTGKLRHS
jgi:hypothetical protein